MCDGTPEGTMIRVLTKTPSIAKSKILTNESWRMHPMEYRGFYNAMHTSMVSNCLFSTQIPSNMQCFSNLWHNVSHQIRDRVWSTPLKSFWIRRVLYLHLRYEEKLGQYLSFWLFTVTLLCIMTSNTMQSIPHTIKQNQNPINLNRLLRSTVLGMPTSSLKRNSYLSCPHGLNGNLSHTEKADRLCSALPRQSTPSRPTKFSNSISTFCTTVRSAEHWRLYYNRIMDSELYRSWPSSCYGPAKPFCHFYQLKREKLLSIYKVSDNFRSIALQKRSQRGPQTLKL